MTTTRANARRNEGYNYNQYIPPQFPLQALIELLNKNIINAEHKTTFQVMAQSHDDISHHRGGNPCKPKWGYGSVKSEGCYNNEPPKFHDSKVEEESQEFIYEIYKVVEIMGVIRLRKRNFPLNQWKEARPEEMGEGEVQEHLFR